MKEDPQLRAELGNNGRKAYEERYSWAIMEDAYLAATALLATRERGLRIAVNVLTVPDTDGLAAAEASAPGRSPMATGGRLAGGGFS